ncbi:MAG: PhnD/SsuA/transferrin family substrate-binding protein [Spirulina sp.]
MKRRTFLGYSLLGLTTGLTLANAGCGTAKNVAKPEKLRFTVTDVPTLQELERDYEAFRQALEEILEIPFDFVPVRSQIAAAGDLKADRIDLVWAGPTEYVAIAARSQAVPVVELTRPNFYSLIVVRADSGIKSLADLKGKTIEMGKPASTVRFLGGFKMLQDAGIDPLEELSIVHSSNRELDSLIAGQVDASVKSSNSYQRALEKAGFNERDYPILARGEALPSDIFVVSSYLEEAWVSEIRDRILEHSDRLVAAIHSVDSLAQRFRDSQFVPADDAHYDMIRDIYHLLGEDDFL